MHEFILLLLVKIIYDKINMAEMYKNSCNAFHSFCIYVCINKGFLYNFKTVFAVDMPANGSYFVCYEAVTNCLVSGTGSESRFFASVFAGGLAGMAYWILGMPADVLKSRFQTAPDGTYKRGIRDVFVELIKTDGPTALYRGVTPVMIRAFPANAACFFGIELCNLFLKVIAPDF